VEDLLEQAIGKLNENEIMAVVLMCAWQASLEPYADPFVIEYDLNWRNRDVGLFEATKIFSSSNLLQSRSF